MCDNIIFAALMLAPLCLIFGFGLGAIFGYSLLAMVKYDYKQELRAEEDTYKP